MSEDIIPARKNQKKAGLGRGLESLLGSATFAEAEDFEIKENVKSAPAQKAPASDPGRVWQLPIEKLIPNKEQPRKIFSQDEIRELSASIKERGIIQPILVRKIEGADQYQVIAGERRWRAAQLAGLKEVTAIIKDADAKTVLELALIENIQRQDLNPMEECEAYQLLARKYNLTQAEIADRVGKDRATVANIMRLAQLSANIREMVLKNELHLGQAKVLLALSDKEDQERLAQKILSEGLSVRATEKIVAALQRKTNDNDAVEIDESDSEENDRATRALATELQKRLGAKVQIDFNGRRGRLSIDFYSILELNQIVDKIQGR